MSHKHHNCSCPHESVKYCKTCRVVHCADCNQEWTAKTQSLWQYNPYQAITPSVTWKDQLGGNGNGNTVKMDPSWQVTPTVTCEHKNDGD